MSTARSRILRWQAETLQDDTQYLAILGGLGCAKTRFIAQFLVNEVVIYPGSRNLLAAVSYPLLMESSFFELKKFLAEMDLKYIYNDNRKTLEFGNGSIIKLQTLDVNEDELRGPEWSSIVIDEAAQIQPSVYFTLVDRARYKIGSRKVRVVSNSKGVSPAHWIAKEFLTNSDLKHKLKTISTKENIKNLPPDYIPNLEKRYPPGSTLHKRWVLGQIVSMEGAVYEEFNESYIVDKIPTLEHLYSGIDFGTRDPTVILTGGLDKFGNLYIIDEFCSSELSPSERIPHIQRLCAGTKIFIDHDPAMQMEMNQAGFNGVYANKDVLLGIDCVRSRFTSKSIFIHKKCNILIDSLYNYAWKQGESEKPDHKFSHAPDALRYLVMGLDEMDSDWNGAALLGGLLGNF